MSFKRFDQARPFATLGIVVVVWLLLPVGVKRFTRATFFEFTAPITIAASHARDLQEYWSMRLRSKHELIEAGSTLARATASFEFSTQQNSELQAEIARLEDLLRLPSFPEYRYEHARVARRDFNGWWQQMVIRKGRNFGISVGAPVVFTGGVVGRITEVHLTTAVVELISSPTFRIAGVVEGDSQRVTADGIPAGGRPVTFQGGINPTFGPPTGLVENVPLEIEMNEGPRRLFTSGLGGIFPPSLILGTIIRLDLGDDGMFKSGNVRLDARLSSLTEVTVLVPINPE